jgi:hypothetical protein
MITKQQIIGTVQFLAALFAIVCFFQIVDPPQSIEVEAFQQELDPIYVMDTLDYDCDLGKVAACEVIDRLKRTDR